MSVRTLLWICWVSVVVCSVQSQDTSLVCPPFADNATVTLTLDVNNSTFSSCTIAPSTVTCSFTPRNGSPASVCSQSVEQCNQAPTALGCWCTGATGTGYKYSLNFTARQNDHEGGDFSCSFDCTIIPPGSSTPPPVSIAPSCLNIAFAASTTAPPNTTTVASTTPPPNTTSASPTSPGQDCPICKKGTDCDEPDLICLLFLLLLIPIAVVIIIVWYCFCHNGGINGNKKAEEGGQKGSPKNQQTSNGTNPADGKGSPQNQQTTNGNRTADGKGSTQNQETTNGNKTADGKRSGQRDNKVGTGHVATNGAHNGEKVSKPVQETELTKVKETSSAPSGEEETSLNGTS